MCLKNEYLVHVRALIQLNHPVDNYFDQCSGQVCHVITSDRIIQPPDLDVTKILKFLQYVPVYGSVSYLYAIFDETCRLALNCLQSPGKQVMYYTGQSNHQFPYPWTNFQVVGCVQLDVLPYMRVRTKQVFLRNGVIFTCRHVQGYS